MNTKRIAKWKSDSREVEQGDYFVAASSRIEERVRTVAEARIRGAERCFAQAPYDQDDAEAINNARWRANIEQAKELGFADSTIPLLAVTGTDGKSTTTHCAWHCLGGENAGAARVGTLGFHNGKDCRTSSHTTPPAEELFSFLAGLDAHCPGAVIEASSHAGAQQRAAGLIFRGLVWTGISRDHMDYHQNAESYFLAKLRWIEQLQSGALCIINDDDARANVVEWAARQRGACVIRLGFSELSPLRIVSEGQQEDENSVYHAYRLYSQYADHAVKIPLAGRHNAWNAIAGALLASAAGVPLATALARLADVPVVPGRMEKISDTPLCFVDYAHTPQALRTVLRGLRQEYSEHHIICVFGCGGLRDAGKRPEMGAIAAAHADSLFITNDNTRGEDAAQITTMIMEGVGQHADVSVIHDRQQACAAALERAAEVENPLVLVAGRGHEENLDLGNERIAFVDAEQLRKLLTT